MRVVELPAQDGNDAVYSAAFHHRLRLVRAFIDGMNQTLCDPVDLLAVRDGVKFDFVVKDSSGAVLAVVRPIADRVSGSIEGMHLQMTGYGGTTGDFGFSAGEVSEAAGMLSERIRCLSGSQCFR